MEIKPEMTLGAAVAIVKYHLADDAPHITKAAAIEMVARMETHNSIKKDDLVGSLRWLFDTYDFTVAEEVVRCQNCRKHGNDEECPLLSMAAYTEPDDFCSCGERKSDA